MPGMRTLWLAAGAAVTASTLILLALGVGETTPGDDFGLGGAGGLSFALAAVGFGVVGTIISARLPGHPVGRLFVGIAVAVGIGDLAYQYADQVLHGDLHGWPGATAAAWLQNVALTPSFGLLALAVLLFPDGRPPSPRWRRTVVVPAAGSLLVAVAYATRPGALDAPFEEIDNPLGLRGAFGLLDAAGTIGWLLMCAGAVLAAVSIAMRLRTAAGVERQQLRWIALAGAAIGFAIAVDVVTFLLDVSGIGTLRLAVVGLAFATLPLAAGAAILRYRLYDIDVVVNRALVYVAVTGTLAATYTATVLLLGLVLPADSDLAVAMSTLAAAAAFRPVRRRVQRAVDRRFFRRRYDADRTLTQFAARVRDEVELTRIADDLQDVVRETVQPAHVSLWLRP
jgi:hypothetical protein